jgi:hypothetical protein
MNGTLTTCFDYFTHADGRITLEKLRRFVGLCSAMTQDEAAERVAS